VDSPRTSAEDVTSGTYDRIAASYDERWTGTTALTPALERFVALLPTHARVLDIGCGTGRHLLDMQAHVAAATGLDLSTSMLDVAKGKGLTALVRGDFRYLPFADETFDGCWAAASILHAPKRIAGSVMSEVLRILRPAGAFFVCLKEGTGEGVRKPKDEPRYMAFYEQAEVDSLFATSGFETIESWRTDDSRNREPWLNWFLKKA